MRSSSPGSWDDLMWRLRAEAAAAEAGDFQAVRALAAGATLVEPPPSLAALAQFQHLQERLGRSLAGRAERIARQLAVLRSVGPTTAAPRRLDLRR